MGKAVKDKFNMAWKCALCAFTAIYLVILINHYTSRHADSKLHAIKCNLNGCLKEYKKLESFACHVRGRHSMFLQSGGPSETGGEPTLSSLDDGSGNRVIHSCFP